MGYGTLEPRRLTAVQDGEAVARQRMAGLGTNDVLQLSLSSLEVAEGLVNARDDEAESPVRRMVMQVTHSVAERRMVASCRNANTNQPVYDGGLVKALVARGCQVLFCTK